jgi:hypothetical protein
MITNFIPSSLTGICLPGPDRPLLKKPNSRFRTKPSQFDIKQIGISRKKLPHGDIFGLGTARHPNPSLTQRSSPGGFVWCILSALVYNRRNENVPVL